jgi:flagellin-like hook-associated protein FlgL
MEDDDTALLTGKYLAGRYTVNASDSLQSLVNKVNAGTQSRVGVQIDAEALQGAVMSGGTIAVCVGNEAYYWGNTSVAVGTVYNTSVYQFSFASNQFVGQNGLWGSGALASLIRNGHGLAASATIKGTAASAAAAGPASLQAAVAAAFAGRMLTSSASGVGGLIDQSFLEGLGIDTLNPLASATYGTKLFGNSSGQWTTSASLAKELGFQELTFSVGPESQSRTENVTDFANHAWFASKTFNPVAASGVSQTTSAHADAQIWVSGNLWTTSATIATSLNFSAMTFGITALTSAAVAASTAAAVDHFKTVFASGATKTIANFGTGIWVSGTTGLWTTSAAVGKSLGASQITIALSATTSVKNTATSAVTSLTDSEIDKLTTSWRLGDTGQVEVDLFYQKGGTDWTTSAKIAAHYNSLHPNALTTTKLTINVGGIGTYNDFRDAVRQSLVSANWTAATAGTAEQITQMGDGWSQAVTKATAATALASGTKRVDKLGSTWTDMANSFASELETRGLSPDTRILSYTARDLTALATQLQGQFSSYATQIDARAIDGNDLAALNVAAKTVKKELAPELTTKGGAIDASKKSFQVGDANSMSASFTYRALASAINNNSDSQFWAMVQTIDSMGQAAEMVYIFTKQGGNFNDLLACEVAGTDERSREALGAISFENLASGEKKELGTSFTLGGEHWGTMKPMQSKEHLGTQVWNVTLNGRDVGKERDLWITNAGEITTPGLDDGIINSMDRNSFVEIQNAADGDWKGAEVRTQSAAQEALDAISEAINKKDKIRADLGALQNRLENTMTNLTVQSENLQASESRISDVDVATEMTEFTRNNVLAQAATSMLAQANSLSQLALSLIR